MSEALTYAKVGELPAKAENGANDWISAIVLVRKVNNRTNYAIANNDGLGNPQVVADFGPAMIIKDVLEIHPYKMRGNVRIPSFASKEDIVEFLVGYGEDREKMEALMSDTFKNGNRKPDGRIESDRAKIKILVEKHSMESAADSEKELEKEEAKNARDNGEEDF